MLLDFKRMLCAFKTGIGYAARPLADLIAETRESRFCEEAARNELVLTEPKTALRQAGEKFLSRREDMDLFEMFVQGLGESDTQGQLEHISLCAELLEGAIARATEERERKSRLYVCMGLFGGITLCMVLL